MKSVTLIRQYDRDRRVAAIKAVRAATGMGLREAKDTCDAVLGLRMGEPVAPAAQTIAVYEDRPDVMSDLRAEFELAEAAPTTDIPREDVLALVFEALAAMDPDSAHAFRHSEAFRKVEGAL
jgi:hypothetical protein